MNLETLGDQIAVTAHNAAQSYLERHGLTANPETLSACLSSNCKARMAEAFADAKAALDCGMNKVAVQTFLATFVLAGIEAAKEACNVPDLETARFLAQDQLQSLP